MNENVHDAVEEDDSGGNSGCISDHGELSMLQMWLILCEKRLSRQLKNVQIHDATMIVAALLLTQLSSARFPLSCLSHIL